MIDVRTPAVVESWLTLSSALGRAAETGLAVPCRADPEPFHADDKATRAEAAEACVGCPVIAACRAYADAAGEGWVWGGVDRGSHPFGQRRPGAGAGTAHTEEVGP